jgi:phenylacetate-CoA ligase
MNASLYTRFASSCLFPLHERLKGHDSRARRVALEKSQWWPREAIEARRRERLEAFLLEAGTHVPYYRDLFERVSFDPRRTELAKLPFLTKDVVRARFEALKSVQAGPVSLYNTGGSTGEPLQFLMGKSRKSHDVAAKWRATRWWGVDIGDPELVIWGSPVELGAQDRVREIRDRLFRTRLLPAFEMSNERVDEFIETIERVRPKMLFGYPSAQAHMARRAKARGIDLSRSGVAVAFVTAEQLLDEQKAIIEEVFGCSVANGYGGRDLGFAAHACPEGGMHISAEDIVVEIVDSDGGVLPVGEEGEIVVTHLATSDFPFIRYRTGDLGVLSDRACRCGRGLPLLESVRGRTTDLVVAEDGTVMHALALIYAVRDVPGVHNFRIVQEDLHHTRVLLVTDDGFPDASEALMKQRLSERLGAGVRISMERVEQIPRSRSGKHRYVESKVSTS